MTETAKAQVLYDGECPLCLNSVAILRRLDWLGRLRYVNARAALPTHDPPLDRGRLLEEMHLLTPDGGRLHHGFGALRWMAWRLPPLWLIAPLLYVPGVPVLGQNLYLWIARHRLQLMPCHAGICTLKPEPGLRVQGSPRRIHILSPDP